MLFYGCFDTDLSFESCCAYFSCCVFPLSDVSAKNLIFLLIHLLTRCFRMLVIYEPGNGLSLLLTKDVGSVFPWRLILSLFNCNKKKTNKNFLICLLRLEYHILRCV